MKKNLYLVLIGKWYDMIQSYEKPEEYRDITPYWIQRIFEMINVEYTHYVHVDKETADFYSDPKNLQLLKDAIAEGVLRPRFDAITFQRAYPKNPPRMTRPLIAVSVGRGNTQWGAIRNKNYIILKLETSYKQ